MRMYSYKSQSNSEYIGARSMTIESHVLEALKLASSVRLECASARKGG